ncbi:hypothetical protein B0H19DRAFT_323323 [Mycena capillaripes]|nr:hypothetical protein B0H19DRAFT_323323 [Mycena capillaripes]
MAFILRGRCFVIPLHIAEVRPIVVPMWSLWLGLTGSTTEKTGASDQYGVRPRIAVDPSSSFQLVPAFQVPYRALQASKLRSRASSTALPYLNAENPSMKLLTTF